MSRLLLAARLAAGLAPAARLRASLGPAGRRLSALAVVGLPLILAGCGLAGPSGSGSPSERPAVSTSPTRIGGTTAPSVAGPGAPPAAVLAFDSALAPGALGSWTLDERGSNSPWLPAPALSEIAVGPSPVSARFADGAQIGAWAARAATANDPTGETARALGGRDEDAPALDAVALEPLPPGRWVISVRLNRSDGRGDATFYWLVVVR